MQLFGCKLKFKTPDGVIIPDRKNFDTLLWSMVTVFQVSFWLHNLCHCHFIASSCKLCLNLCLCYSLLLNISIQLLTQEDWNLVLYKAMAATSPWAALYFIAFNILGKHVFLNVLVGIVVKSFQPKVRPSFLVFSKSLIFLKLDWKTTWLLSTAYSNTNEHTNGYFLLFQRSSSSDQVSHHLHRQKTRKM